MQDKYKQEVKCKHLKCCGIVGVQAPSDLGCDDFLARNMYATTECESVEIREQSHSNCLKNKNVHKCNCYNSKKDILKAYIINKSYSINTLNMTE